MKQHVQVNSSVDMPHSLEMTNNCVTERDVNYICLKE